MIKDHLHRALKQTLPGLDAQRRMAVPGRYNQPEIPETAKKAAVLVLLYKKLDRVFVALIRRKIKDSDRHSGQISFPGGRMEQDEDYPIQTALREAQEEIGIPAGLEILGLLTPLYIPISDFHVVPVVAWSDQDFLFTLQRDEVDELIELDLALISNPEVKIEVDITVAPNMILKRVPAYEVYGMIIWGATAMMLSELETVLENVA